MDRQLKAILDEFLPYTEEESKFGEASAALRDKKNERRKQLADAIENYKAGMPLSLPGLNVNMYEVIRKLQSNN